MTQILYKRSAESIQFMFDVSADLAPGVQILTVTSILPDQVTVPPLFCSSPFINGLPITFPDTNTVAPPGSVVSFTIAGGLQTEENAPYLIRMLYQTTDQETAEAIGFLAVNDFPPLYPDTIEATP